jgi:uncharacterized lipoprotein YddW (UPF0748 family)
MKEMFYWFVVMSVVVVSSPKLDFINWESVEGSPVLKVNKEKLEFDLRFDTLTNWRFAWDQKVNWNLSNFDRLELTFSENKSDALGEAVLFVESGQGWYRFPAFRPSGKVTLFTAQAGVEGRPSGWSDINRVRMSFLPVIAQKTVATLLNSEFKSGWEMSNFGAISSFSTTQKAIDSISALAVKSNNSKEVVKRIDEVKSFIKNFDVKLIKDRDSQRELRWLRRRLSEAWALVQKKGPSDEYRALYVHYGNGPLGLGTSNETWQRVLPEIKKQGFNVIVPNVLWSGVAYYPSEIVPNSATLGSNGDYLGQIVDISEKIGLKVHAWKVMFQFAENWLSPESNMLPFKKAGRLQLNDKGDTLSWLSPCLDENVKYEVDAISEMASSYNIDGVLLDYIRFQNTGVDFNPACRVKFESFLGQTVEWPNDAAVGGKQHEKFLEFRRDLITDIVKKIRVALDKIDTTLVLSASVFSHPKVAKTSVGQDWVKWAELGLLDYVATMTYTGGVGEFERTVELQKKALEGIDVPLYPILGAVKAKFDIMDLDVVVDQINVVREANLKGYALFELNGYIKRLHLPYLSAGLNRGAEEVGVLGHSGPLFNKRYPSDPKTGAKDYFEDKVLLGDFEKLNGDTEKGGKWTVSTSPGTEREGDSFVEKGQERFFRVAGVLGESKIPLNWSWAAGCLILKGGWLPMDLSSYKQIRAKVRGTSGLYSVLLQKSTVKDYAHYKFDFTPTSETDWTEMVFPFEQFFQASWAKPQDRIFTDVHTICFNPAVTSGKFDLQIDDVWLEK